MATVGWLLLFVLAGIYLWKKLFPTQAKRISNKISAGVLNLVMQLVHATFAKQKIEAFKDFKELDDNGKAPHILEIGVGSGMNLAFFPEQCRMSCLEPNGENRPYLLRALQQYPGIKMDKFCEGFAEDMKEFEDNTFDAVVCTYVMCSMRHVDKALSEIKRVLKPGGTFLFLEHVAAPRTSPVARLQRWLDVVWPTLFDGCHLTRETWSVVEQAGFSKVQLTHFTKEGMKLSCFIKFGIYGVAVK